MITIISDIGSFPLEAVPQWTRNGAVVLPESPIAGGTLLVDDIQKQPLGIQLEAIVPWTTALQLEDLLEADGFVELVGPTIQLDNLRLATCSYTKTANDYVPITLGFKQIQTAEILTTAVTRKRPIKKLSAQGKQKPTTLSPDEVRAKTKSLLAQIKDSGAAYKVISSAAKALE